MVINKEKQNKKEKNIYYVAIISLVIIVFLFTGYFIWGIMISKFMDVRVLEYIKVRRDIKTDGLLIKRETVIRTPERGKVKYLVADGTRLRVGVPVASIQTTDLNTVYGQANSVLYAPQSGTFCLHLDGYEQVLSPENLDVMQIPKLEGIDNKAVNAAQKKFKDVDIIESGQPVYKLVDNLKPLLVKLELADDQLPERVLGVDRWLKLQWQGFSFFGRSVDYKKQGAVCDILISVDEYPHELAHYRKIPLSIVTQELAGLLVDRKSIVLKDGQPGIYSLNKVAIRWVPVKIEGQSENKVVVSGEELTEGMRYIHNPIWYKVGSLVL